MTYSNDLLIHFIQNTIFQFKQFKNYSILYPNQNIILNGKNIFESCKGKLNISFLIQTFDSLFITFSNSIIPFSCDEKYCEVENLSLFEVQKNDSQVNFEWKIQTKENFKFYVNNEDSLLLSLFNCFDLYKNYIEFNKSCLFINQFNIYGTIGSKEKEELKRILVIEWN